MFKPYGNLPPRIFLKKFKFIIEVAFKLLYNRGKNLFAWNLL